MDRNRSPLDDLFWLNRQGTDGWGRHVHVSSQLEAARYGLRGDQSNFAQAEAGNTCDDFRLVTRTVVCNTKRIVMPRLLLG